jgi:hypothetical protein
MSQQNDRSLGRVVNGLYGTAEFAISRAISEPHGLGGFITLALTSHKFIRVDVPNNR